MDQQTVFHKEICPTGMRLVIDDGYCRGEIVPQSGMTRECTFSGESMTTIFGARGCVDNPAKFGLNVWSPSDEEQVMKTMYDFEARRIPSKDSPTFQADLNREKDDEIEELKAKLEYERGLNRELRENMNPAGDLDDRHKIFKRDTEKLQDFRSGAAKITDGIERGTPQGQVPGDLTPPAGDPGEIPPHEEPGGQSKAVFTAEQRKDMIKAVIRGLDPENPLHFTKGGLAEIPFLEKETGFDDITAAERNEAQDEVAEETVGE